MSMNYTQEKFWQAVHVLATAAGPIRERLSYAMDYLSRLHHIRAEERGFVGYPELHARFNRLMAMLTEPSGAPRDGVVSGPIAALSDADAKKAADEIFDLFLEASVLAEIPVGFQRDPPQSE